MEKDFKLILSTHFLLTLSLHARFESSQCMWAILKYMKPNINILMFNIYCNNERWIIIIFYIILSITQANKIL